MPRTETLVIIAVCAALNMALGTVVYLLKLPIYVDMTGTILGALLFAHRPAKGFIVGATAGVVSFVLGGLVVNPFLPWFSGTVVAVAALTAFVTSRSAKILRSRTTSWGGILWRVIAYGVLTGVVAAIVSAPIVVFLFGGVTGSGSAMLVAFFLKIGNQLMQAALLSGFTAEPVDKTLQVLLAVSLFRATPESFLRMVAGATTTPATSRV